MHRRPQLGMCENPDSPRVHGLRQSPDVEQNQPHIGKNTSSYAARKHKTSELPIDDAPFEATTERREDSERLLTVEEVAALLHVPISWVYGRLRKPSAERLPAYRLGKYWRFRQDEIHAWVKHQCGDGHSA